MTSKALLEEILRLLDRRLDSASSEPALSEEDLRARLRRQE